MDVEHENEGDHRRRKTSWCTAKREEQTVDRPGLLHLYTAISQAVGSLRLPLAWASKTAGPSGPEGVKYLPYRRDCHRQPYRGACHEKLVGVISTNVWRHDTCATYGLAELWLRGSHWAPGTTG